MIAAINGICAAGGLEMMWNTDLRVCADDAWFQLAEPRRGLFPGGGSTVHSARQLSWCNAMEVVLLADRITPAARLEMGLVNRVVPRDQVMAEARALAETICLNGPLAVRACKQSAKESTFLAAQGGARERDELLGERLHERRREGGHRGVQGEADAGVEGEVG